MAKFGHVLISGVVWVLLALAVGLLGSWLTTLSGLWAILGWPVALLGFGFALMSALHLWRITRLQMQAMRWEQDDPEGFEDARREFEEAQRP